MARNCKLEVSVCLLYVQLSTMATHELPYSPTMMYTKPAGSILLKLTRWWFQKKIFSPLLGEMIQFDYNIFQLS